MKLVDTVLRYLFFAIFVRFVVLIILGVNIRRKHKLPQSGPAILVANHNSHLDTGVLMTLLPVKVLHKIHPVAAIDYFLSSPILSWFARAILNVIPITRMREADQDPLMACSDSLNQGDILIFFPEGTRGEPEKLSSFKKGIGYLAERHADVPIFPIYMHGLGKALPKGATIPVPFFCDIFVGDSIKWNGNLEAFMSRLDETMKLLAQEGDFPSWD